MAVKVMICTYCMGTGKNNDDKSTPKKPCPHCDGKGTQEVQV
jgi:DnaJ-class molecular chaperone